MNHVSATADPGWTPLHHVRLAGLEICTASRDELAVAAIADAAARRRDARNSRARLIFDANGHGLSLHATDAGFREDLDSADVIHADGGFLVTASRWLTRTPIAERSATTDLIHDIANRAARTGTSFYLLGGTEDANRECAKRLQQQYPGLKIAGRRNGYFQAAEVDAVVDEINSADADIVWVGLGKPLEQRFCVQVRDRLQAAWLVTCGGCYNYITGDYPRAPEWMQRLNLEWLHRMATNPRKLFMRYLLTTPHALWLLFKGACTQAFASP